MKTYTLIKKPNEKARPRFTKDCIICGQPLVYTEQSDLKTCLICHRTFSSNVSCRQGHYVCDECHSLGIDDFLPLLLNSTEKDPGKILQRLMVLPSVHMHGPEHHVMVPAALLTANKNCGGELDLGLSLKEASLRGSQIPGGACGNWGMCGAAAGAGIYASIVSGSTSLNKEAWPKPILLTSRCLERISKSGGPRCCKRTSYIAVQTAVEFTAEFFKITMPMQTITCRHFRLNRECLQSTCPFYPAKEDEGHDPLES